MSEEEIAMASLGCFFFWLFLRLLCWVESPEMALCVGLGVTAKAYWRFFNA